MRIENKTTTEIEVNDDNWTGNSTTLAVDLVNSMQAKWSHNGYDFTIDIQTHDQSKWDVKRGEQWVTYTLNGDGWSDELHTGHFCISEARGKNELVEAIKVAHGWISNHI